jgi:hypothetical protein
VVDKPLGAKNSVIILMVPGSTSEPVKETAPQRLVVRMKYIPEPVLIAASGVVGLLLKGAL